MYFNLGKTFQGFGLCLVVLLTLIYNAVEQYFFSPGYFLGSVKEARESSVICNGVIHWLKSKSKAEFD